MITNARLHFIWIGLAVKYFFQLSSTSLYAKTTSLKREDCQGFCRVMEMLWRKIPQLRKCIMTCIYSLYLILPAYKWLSPFSADVEINK